MRYSLCKNTDHIYIRITGHSQSCNTGSVYVGDAIDLSKYSKIKIDCSVEKNSYGNLLYFVKSVKPDGIGVWANTLTAKEIANCTTLERTVLEKDITEISDTAYITVGGELYKEAVNVSTESIFRIYRLWLE